MKIFPLQTAHLAGALLLAFASVSSLHAEGKPGWSDDQPKAFAQAKADKKMVLMDFTGSDWCSWCIKMDKDVFNTPEFKAYAKDHLVLLELDLPQEKPISPETRQQNEKLVKEYNVEGFPTLIVLDSEGKPLKQFMGYQEGGPQAFIAELQKLKG